MGDRTSIEWADSTWGPVTGCTEVSPGCDRCYAKTMAERFRGTPGHYFENGFDVQLRRAKLALPLSWRAPRRVFVNSMSDLFHDQVPDDYIARVFAVMLLAHRHTFQVLTKRHGRMRSLLSSPAFRVKVLDRAYLMANDEDGDVPGRRALMPYETLRFLHDGAMPWPLPNVWLGVSVENQQWANIRIPALADTPAAVRFLSCEPLLGPVDLTPWLPQAEWSSTDPFDGIMHLLSQNGRCDHQPTEFGYRHEVAKCRQCTNGRRISWVIVGGESGHGARPMQQAWARSLRDQCVVAGVPFLFKQWGAYGPANATDDPDLVIKLGKKAAGRELDGRTWDEFPQGVMA